MGDSDHMADILVVDDDEDLREMAAMKLRMGGHRVTLAADGRQALQLAAAQRFDAVILDVAMPGINGVDVLARLRTMPGYAGVPVIMCTAAAGDAATERAFAAGADEYLTKPFSPADMATRVGYLLAR